MFSDDFWSEADPQGKQPSQITLVGLFGRILTSMRAIFAAKHAPDYAQDALGDQVTLPKEFANRSDAAESN